MKDTYTHSTSSLQPKVTCLDTSTKFFFILPCLLHVNVLALHSVFIFFPFHTDAFIKRKAVFNLDLIFTETLGPWASTKVESHASFNGSHKTSQLTKLFAMFNTKRLGKTII